MALHADFLGKEDRKLSFLLDGVLNGCSSAGQMWPHVLQGIL